MTGLMGNQSAANSADLCDKDRHLIGQAGEFVAYWKPDLDAVELCVYGASVRHWDCEPSLSEIADMIEEATHGGRALSAEEIAFVIHTGLSVEAHIEHANRDLREHGAIGVTY